MSTMTRAVFAWSVFLMSLVALTLSIVALVNSNNNNNTTPPVFPSISVPATTTSALMSDEL